MLDEIEKKANEHSANLRFVMDSYNCLASELQMKEILESPLRPSLSVLLCRLPRIFMRDWRQGRRTEQE